ncbi:hypothetical protein F5Y10DRAFT_247541 [Nemania abortiva]|nr:hypothetical protein F5Y10DRAFT_247541 [Nemania abortiva]
MSKDDRPLEDPAVEQHTNTADATSAAAEDSEGLQVIKVGGDGHVSYLDMDSLEEYLDCVPDKAEALETIVTDIAVVLEKEEALKEWTSEIHDLIARKKYWQGGGHGTLKAWLSAHPTFFDSAKQGRMIRNRKTSAINSLISNGVSGPRFEYMIRCQSRTFIEAVRKQVDMHGFSYPLVCALSNVKAYHRLKAGRRGAKGAQTQTIDVADLDTVTYRKLSPTDLKAIKAKVGPHGFLVEARAEDVVIIDRDFDTATGEFIVGCSGFQQLEQYGRTQPKIAVDDSDEEEEDEKQPKKQAKPNKKTDTFDIPSFLYVSECTCPTEVPQALVTNLDKLAPNCGYCAVSSLLPDVLEFCGKLCPRHCQLTLVKALGRNHLVHKTDSDSLQAEIRELVPKLEHCVLGDANMKSRFDSYKKSIGFSWDAVETTAVPQSGSSHQEGASRPSKNKRKRAKR